MDAQIFNSIVADRFKKTQGLLKVKGDEYTGKNADRLANFKDSVKITEDGTPKQALLGMVRKHIVALYEFARREAEGGHVPLEHWDEKIGDIIVYMLLLEGLVYDELWEAKL